VEDYEAKQKKVEGGAASALGCTPCSRMGAARETCPVLRLSTRRSPLAFNPSGSEGLSPCGAYSVRFVVEETPVHVWLLSDDYLPSVEPDTPASPGPPSQGPPSSRPRRPTASGRAGEGLQNCVTLIGSTRCTQALSGGWETSDLTIPEHESDTLWATCNCSVGGRTHHHMPRGFGC